MHDLAEKRSLAMHRVIAARLATDTGVLADARERVATWRADGTVHSRYADAWYDLLTGPLNRLIQVLQDPGEEARALRQCSPFAGAIEPRERWQIWRETRERWEQRVP